MKSKFCALVCSLLIVGCAASPAFYGDESGFMGLGFIAKKTVVVAYEGPVRSFHEVGVVVLDSRLRLRTIRSPNGETINGRKMTKGGLGVINTPNDEQIHFAPGTYTLSFCFYINVNQGAIYCRAPIDTQVTVSAGEISQVSWAEARGGGWTVIRQPVSDEIRRRVTSDFSEVMATTGDSS